MSQIKIWLSLAVVACISGIVMAEVKSGLQVGDYVDAFDVKDCSLQDPSRDTARDPWERAGGIPETPSEARRRYP